MSKVRYAVAGLGHFAQAAILPAFANARENSELAALVTGDDDKSIELGKRYGVPAVGYDEYDRLLASGKVDAVYIALPNSHHRDYTIRAAQAGIHVLCEKPMAYTSADCRAMIDACTSAKVRLMVGYRLHFEEGNLHAIELIQSGKIGEPRLFLSAHTQQIRAGNTRLDRELEGGPLEDIGIYCINAARYLFRAEPTEAAAHAVHGADPRFREVPEAVSAILRFPNDRLATFVCGFGEARATNYRVLGTKGTLIMDPAYTWQDDLQMVLELGDKKDHRTFEHRDQVAAELLYFSNCVRNNQDPEPSGQEGLIDVRIIEALRTSYTEGRSVPLERLPDDDKRPDADQSIQRPPAREPKLVNAEPPGRK